MCGIDRFANSNLFELNWFFRYQLPATVFSSFANAFGTRAQQKQASKLWFYVGKARAVADGFSNFTSNEWFFETASHAHLLARLSPREQAKYSFDTASLDWPTCVRCPQPTRAPVPAGRCG